MQKGVTLHAQNKVLCREYFWMFGTQHFFFQVVLYPLLPPLFYLFCISFGNTNILHYQGIGVGVDLNMMNDDSNNWGRGYKEYDRMTICDYNMTIWYLWGREHAKYQVLLAKTFSKKLGICQAEQKTFRCAIKSNSCKVLSNLLVQLYTFSKSWWNLHMIFLSLSCIFPGKLFKKLVSIKLSLDLNM